MNQVLTAAGAVNKNETGDRSVNGELFFDIESSMESIIRDSEKIAAILTKVKKRQN
jgi:hypothetical protein